MSLKIAVITDIHHGIDAEAKKGSQALRLMAEFASFVEREKPDLVLDLGDRISDENAECDAVLERDIHLAFEPVRAIAPVFHICGNHDRDFQSVADNEAIFGQKLGNEVLAIKGWSIVLFRADSRIARPHGFHCPDDDIAWLKDTVQAASGPTLVASHVPMSGHSQIGNYYFERNPHYATYPQAAQLREALSTAKVPVMCIAGHVHWNTVTVVDGIPHLTQQSLTESFTMSDMRGSGTAAGAYGLLTLDDTNAEWQVFGDDPFFLRLSVPRMMQRWYAPLGPFDSNAEEQARQDRIAAFRAAGG